MAPEKTNSESAAARKKKMEDLLMTKRVIATQLYAIKSDIPNMVDLEYHIHFREVESLSQQLTENIAGILKLAPADEQEDYEADFLRSKRLVMSLLTTLSPAPTPPSSQSPAHSSTGSCCTAPTHTAAATLKLPQVDLPTFNGQSSQWPAFSANFNSIIGRFPGLSDSDKLHYLQAAMRDNAKHLIAYITPGSGNAFNEAWDILESRFKNHRHTVYGIVRRLIHHAIPTDNAQLERFLDTVRSSFATLTLLGLAPTDCDYIWNVLILDKCNQDINSRFEQAQASDKVPPTDQLLKFLHGSLQVQTYTNIAPRPVSLPSAPIGGTKQFRSSKCPECQLDHLLMRCPVYNKASNADKYTIIKKHRLCTNCLGGGHGSSTCKRGVCRTCGKTHHTSLHKDIVAQPPKVNVIQKHDLVLLQTAIVHLHKKDGSLVPMRALLDSGAMVSLITSNAIQLLQIKPRRIDTSISAVGGKEKTLTQVADLALSSTDGQFFTTMSAYAMPKITSDLPGAKVHANWPHLSGLHLADPGFHIPAKIDILLGADVLPKLLCPDIRQSENAPTAQLTKLGWVLQGPAGICSANVTPLTGLLTVESTTAEEPSSPQLSKFWEIEELSSAQPILTPDEERAESLFRSTTTLLPNGRYCVQLPLRSQPPNIGDTKKAALARFNSLEKRFQRDEKYAELYKFTIKDYMETGHLQRVRGQTTATPVYLPHHGVLNANKKLRIVFDASARSSNGKSLNDELLNGPKTQQELFDIVVRFRTHAVAVTADIVQMYRQIAVHPDNYHLQRILWRDSPQSPIEEYEITVVTWGTKPASFLATRVLQDIAERAAEFMPMTAHKIKNDFYVDDFLSGAPTEADARRLQTQVSQLLSNAGLTLHKWSSNVQSVLQDETNKNPTLITSGDTKTLGIKWHPTTDQFSLMLAPAIRHPKVTKRTVLSDLGRLFDPLGWVTPVMITAKIFMQKLCQDTSLSWDSTLSADKREQWQKFMEEVQQLEIMRIPRNVIATEATPLTICGFSDASEAAYAAVVYIRQQQPDGSFATNLMASKTKVAPTKPVSLPRLELCGAVLLARLISKVVAAIKLDSTVVAFTDSTITLHWIKGHPSRWKTFVGHRVQEVQALVSPHAWYHVSSEDNPADLGTRKTDVSTLLNSHLWWHGPSWLSTTEWKVQSKVRPPDGAHLEERAEMKHALLVHKPVPFQLLQRYENLNKTLRILAYVRRALTRTKLRTTGLVSAAEIKAAKNTMLKLIQAESFSNEVSCIKAKKPVLRDSPLHKLLPYLDNDGLLRVGGRLQNSELNESAKHPIILPYSHPTTKLLVRQLHTTNGHAGPQLLTAIVLQEYFMPRLRNMARFVTRTCATCTRTRAKLASQLMAQLPDSRVLQATRPFQRCGVDLAGPISLRTHLSRGTRHYKGYICLFVCMATRALHLELVSSLSAEAFLAAFHRLSARRSTPAEMFSDNGTNFTSASKILKQLQEDAAVHNHLAAREVTWTFNPPAAPHWGGVWEAGVKSVKYHLTNIVKTQVLTFEEMSTVLCRIEAILNSRPLTAMSTEPSDLEALTPGHFLVGAPLTAPPEQFSDSKLLPNERWQLVQRISQNFWTRWSNEYLTRLNQRPKWCRPQAPITNGDLVIVKEENVAPLKWRLGRVVDTHLSSDGLCRAVTVKTQFGKFQRPIQKVARLPLDDGPLDEDMLPSEPTKATRGLRAAPGLPTRDVEEGQKDVTLRRSRRLREKFM